MKAVTAVSTLSNTKDAVQEALESARTALGDQEKLIAGLVFVGADHAPEQVAQAMGRFEPQVPLIGCTTDGEISSQGLSMDSVTVMLLASNQVEARSAVVRDLGRDSFDAGCRIAKALHSPTAKTVILLPDGLTGNGSAVIRGAQEVLGRSFVIAGGTAGDRGRFQKTWQFHRSEVCHDAIVGLVLESSGPLEVGFGVMSGWKPIGISKKVTKAEGNTVYRIEDQTALDVYAQYLGDKADQLPSIGIEYPFALVDESGVVGEKGIRDGEEYILLRAPMTVDRDQGAVGFAGEIPEGSKVRMTRAKSQDLIEASREAAQRTMNRMTGKPDAVLFFSCTARKMVLGRKTKQEIDAAQEAFGPEVPMVGFYTYGEIANCGEKAPICRLHNETATFLAIREG